MGDHEKLGNWSTDDAAELKWSDGHVWTADMDIPEDSNVEYKVVNVKGQGDPRWEKGGNYTGNCSAPECGIPTSCRTVPSASSTAGK